MRQNSSKTYQSLVTECTQINSKDEAIDFCGNGDIRYFQKSFCLNGECNDVTVCMMETETGEEKYYLPLHGDLNFMKELVIYALII